MLHTFQIQSPLTLFTGKAKYCHMSAHQSNTMCVMSHLQTAFRGLTPHYGSMRTDPFQRFRQMPMRRPLLLKFGEHNRFILCVFSIMHQLLISTRLGARLHDDIVENLLSYLKRMFKFYQLSFSPPKHTRIHRAHSVDTAAQKMEDFSSSS